jgi:hypothetical protein
MEGYEPENTKEAFKVKNFFEKADIVVLAESAHGTHDETILEIIKACEGELDGIFEEVRANYQPSVNTYIETGKVDERLERFFIGARAEGQDIRGMLRVFDRARELGIPVICIDSSGVRTPEYNHNNGCYFLRGESRDEDMAQNIRNYYSQHPGKYLVIAGAAHVEKRKHFKTGLDTLESYLVEMYPDNTHSVLMVSQRGKKYAEEAIKRNSFDDVVV